MQAPFPWLRPRAVDELERGLAADEAAEPFSWKGGIAWRAGRRYLHVGTGSLATLAEAEDVALSHPLLDPAFVAALAALPRGERFRSRQGAMDALFGDVLPGEVRARRTKAAFDGAFWHAHSRELVERWSGEGIDESLVDADRLRAEWRSDAPDPRTFTLLQSVKIALDLGGRGSAGERGEEPLSGFVEAAPAVRPAELPGREAGELEEPLEPRGLDAQA
jgi:asparagine synthase (glutamine-hydrolysing)